MPACATRLLLFLVCFAATAAAAAGAECSVAAGAPRQPLVELYTSEGCSSCPPADAWLRRLPQAAVALGFHVDYWDSPGWRDRFSDPRYTRRQEEQARRDRGSGTYTPQVVIDGRSRPDWYRAEASIAPTGAGLASMRVQASATRNLHVVVETVFASPADGRGFRNLLAATEDGLVSPVRGGENRGALLHHDHVVRAFSGPLALGAEADLRLPADADIERTTVVAFAQRDDGVVAQVVACPLHVARPRAAAGSSR